MDIGKDLQNAFDEGYKKGYYQGEKDAAPKWTPVSEGLPDENEDVLVTAVFSDGQKEVGTLSLNKGKWTNGYFSYNDAVTAWMPKPKPYEDKKE